MLAIFSARSLNINPINKILKYDKLFKLTYSLSNRGNQRNDKSVRSLINIDAKDSNIKRYKRYPCMFLIAYQGTQYKGIQYSPLIKSNIILLIYLKVFSYRGRII